MYTTCVFIQSLSLPCMYVVKLSEVYFTYMHVMIVGVYHHHLPNITEFHGEGRFSHAILDERFVFDRGCSSNCVLLK